MNAHKNKKMLGTILKDPEHSITFKSTCTCPEIQDVNVFNSIYKFIYIKETIKMNGYRLMVVVCLRFI
jgi:hypothetical protein